MGRRFSNGVLGGNDIGQINLIENELSTAELNANLLLDPSGTGVVEIDSTLQINSSNTIKFLDADGDHFVALDVPATVASDVTLTLPNTNGTSGYFLQTDGSGNMSWQDVAVEVETSSSSSTFYPLFSSNTSGQITDVQVANASAKLSFVPSTGTLTAKYLSGVDITISGTMSAATITESSSIALKENVNPISNAIDSISQLVGVTYDRKDGSKINEAGLIAEEVHKVLPNLVSTDEEGNPAGIMYTKLTAYLIEAVKTLKEEINELKGQK